MNRPPLLRTLLLLVLAFSAFNLGRYSAEFSGSVWAWSAVVLGIVVLALTLFSLISEFWRSNTPRP
jgi:hypothetical protein